MAPKNVRGVNISDNREEINCARHYILKSSTSEQVHILLIPITAVRPPHPFRGSRPPLNL